MPFQLNHGVAQTLALPRFGPTYMPRMVSAIASCSAAISRLDARISASSVASAWHWRAAWTGFTKALQLQSVEIDEIDVFSWGCGLRLADRPRRATNTDEFAGFDEWRAALRDESVFAWRDGLPTAVGEPDGAADHPHLIRALDQVRQLARLDGSTCPWLALPFALRDLKLTNTPLPCLAGGVKAFRMMRTLGDGDWLAAIRALQAAAEFGLERLDLLEAHHRNSQRAIASEYRASALPRLLALSCHRPLLSPQGVADCLGLSNAGAGKLLDRAVDADLLIEITDRKNWRQFLVPDLAIDFGFASPKRGRPASTTPPLPRDRALAAVFDAFDDEMAQIDRMLSNRADQIT